RLIDRPTSAQGQTIEGEKIVASASRADVGQAVSQAQPLSTSKTLIYESDDAGSAASFVVEYQTSEDLSSQTAGRYKSTLEFVVESDSAAQFMPPVTVPIEFEIETLFYLDVNYESAGGLSFGKFKSEGDAQTRRVKVTTHNNTGQRYQVIQRVSR